MMRLNFMAATIAALTFAVGLAQPAEAKKHRHHTVQHQSRSVVPGGGDCTYTDSRVVCMGGAPPRGRAAYDEAGTPGRNYVGRERGWRHGSTGEVMAMLSHPSGCPGRAFCGCGASVDVFGHSVRSLWQSCAWFDGRFPRSSGKPGDVAGGCGHVFVLVSHVEGSNWVVNDYNSGGHQSRRHVRSIAGAKIVDPHGGHLAYNQ